MPALKADSIVTYHGYWSKNGGPVIGMEDGRGTQIGVVQHLPKHSPTGMNWGYCGSGPADTARSLLIAALGDEAVCRMCRGSGRVVYVRDSGDLVAEPYNAADHPWARQGWQCECDSGYQRLPYPAFTEEFVAVWGREWVISRAAIVGWLEQHQTS